MTWTDDMIAKLKECIATKLSGSQCAAFINHAFNLKLSRNAIIGKVNRLHLTFNSGLGGNQKPVGSPATKFSSTYQPKRKYPPMEPVTPIEGQSYDNDRRTYGIVLTDLSDTVCHFPLWDEDDEARFYCGAASVEGLPYCTHHYRRTHIKSTKQSTSYTNFRRW